MKDLLKLAADKPRYACRFSTDHPARTRQLSSHATDGLGVCIANRIKGWKFRQSSGTKTFKITLVFQSG